MLLFSKRYIIYYFLVDKALYLLINVTNKENKYMEGQSKSSFVSEQFRKIIMRYKRIGYNLNVMRQSACLVFNPVKVDGYATLFNCTPVDRASDSMMAPT